MDILQEVKKIALPGLKIPKPISDANYQVIKWVCKNGENIMYYSIPNKINASKPYTKSIKESDFKKAYFQLSKVGLLNRIWFNKELQHDSCCHPCNFTTIGGIFELLEITTYDTKLKAYVKK